MSDTAQVELREYIERILDEREKALVLTAQSLDKRLDHLNALREDVVRDRNTYATREVFSSLEDRVEKLERWQSRVVGIVAVLIVCSGAVGGIISHLLTK